MANIIVNNNAIPDIMNNINLHLVQFYKHQERQARLIMAGNRSIKNTNSNSNNICTYTEIISKQFLPKPQPTNRGPCTQKRKGTYKPHNTHKRTSTTKEGQKHP